MSSQSNNPPGNLWPRSLLFQARIPFLVEWSARLSFGWLVGRKVPTSNPENCSDHFKPIAGRCRVHNVDGFALSGPRAPRIASSNDLNSEIQKHRHSSFGFVRKGWSPHQTTSRTIYRFREILHTQSVGSIQIWCLLFQSDSKEPVHSMHRRSLAEHQKCVMLKLLMRTPLFVASKCATADWKRKKISLSQELSEARRKGDRLHPDKRSNQARTCQTKSTAHWADSEWNSQNCPHWSFRSQKRRTGWIFRNRAVRGGIRLSKIAWKIGQRVSLDLSLNLRIKLKEQLIVNLVNEIYRTLISPL